MVLKGTRVTKTPYDTAGEITGHVAEKLEPGVKLWLDSAIAGAIQAASNEAMLECRRKHGPPTLRVKLNYSDSQLPKWARDGDAALDLYAAMDYVVPEGGTSKLDTGISLEIPYGYFAKIETRSGMASKGQFVTGGVIDASYRGPVHVVLNNYTSEPWPIKKGYRIAQMLILPVFAGAIEEAKELSETERGDKGFGSTGR